jgi:outer membrane protein TolC
MKFVVLLITIFGQISAQQIGQPIRLVDCIVQALGKNPALQISEAKVQVAEARSSEATTALLPQLKLTGRAAELSKVDPFGLDIQTPSFSFSRVIFPSITENYSMRLTLQQPVFTGFKLMKIRKAAELNADATREDLSKDQSDLVLNVIIAYWNLYRAIKVEEVISQSVDQMSEHLKDITNLEKQGLATGADVMKVQVQFSDVKVKYIEARNAIRLASMALNTMIRNNLDTQIQPIDTPVIQTSKTGLLQEDLKVLQGRARQNRPEMKAMNLRQEMNRVNVTATKGGWYPQIFLAANYDYSKPNQRIIPPRNQWDGTWDVGVTLQWNIWDWWATGYQTDQAEASLRQTEAGMVQLTDAVTLEVAQQYFNLQTATEKVDVTLDGVEQAQESHRMTSEKFKNGVASNADLLDAETALLQAKLTHTQAVVECTLDLSRLKRAVGDNQ